MVRTTPPFRADMVGSLLRPLPLKEARGKFAKGEIDAAALKAVEDREIEKIIVKQQEVGLKLATDGEFRRSWWHFDFFRGLSGVTPITTSTGIKFHGVETKHEAIKITGKVDFVGHPQIEHFKFLQGALQGHAENVHPGAVDVPFPARARDGEQRGLSRLRRILRRLSRATWRKAIRAFYDAGCRYLQLDDTAWAMMCDPKEREQSKARGDDPDQLPAIYARVTNAALQGKPADMAITMHSCRGNFRSTFIASGGYEFVAEQLLGNTNLDGYFLEYDSDRAGGFEPLRFFPKGKKQLVLGLVTSKSGRLEPRDDDQAPHRGGDQICRARPALPVAAMRLRLHRGRQRAGRGRAVGQAAHDRGTGGRGVGEVVFNRSFPRKRESS